MVTLGITLQNRLMNQHWRAIKALPQQHIETPIAKLIIKGALPENHTIVVEMKNTPSKYVKNKKPK